MDHTAAVGPATVDPGALEVLAGGQLTLDATTANGHGYVGLELVNDGTVRAAIITGASVTLVNFFWNVGQSV